MRDSLLDRLELSTGYMSRLNVLTRELSELSGVVGIDMAQVNEANQRAGDEFQRACSVLDELGDDGTYESESFVDDMDQLIGERSTLLNPTTRRIKNLQEVIGRITSGAIFHSSSSPAVPPMNPTSKQRSRSVVGPTGHASAAPEDSPKLSPLKHHDEPVVPILEPDDHEAADDHEAEMKKTRWEKARRVVIPLAGGVAGAVLLGPAGFFIGLKGAAMIGAASAVGAGVGALSGAAVSIKLDKGAKKEESKAVDGAVVAASTESVAVAPINS